ncbi:MAG: glycine cleavage system aminomethyltransferase GcvT [Deltaproteobacteria bacterium]|nr:glycine cleavage system aminomethyltransferase GcvT [Deltaproteobacteria bacterium]
MAYNEAPALKRTPLHDVHTALGARLVNFAGWGMPVQYTGVIEEHLNVRRACGLFDVSHMGEIEISGAGAHALVQRLFTNDIDRVGDGQCQYTLLCYPHGGVVDDCIVYRYNKGRFLVCVNASNTGKVLAWIESRASAQGGQGGAALVEDLSDNYAQLALQGPASADVLRPLMDIEPEDIEHFHFVMCELKGGVEALVSRTGYTGEDGFEIYLEPEHAVDVWQALMDSGRVHGIKPAGLGARDTLRLEKGYPLYGHELSEDITPIEAGLKKYVRFNRDFIGKEALEKQAAFGVGKTLIGFQMTAPGIPRAGYELSVDGNKAGWVTSGTLSPSLNVGIGMGYVDASVKAGEMDVIIRNRPVRARVVKLPFYNRPS